jgi:Flp pilus assembly pilin Flp
MTAWFESTARALADRRGATSLEYAMIAVGAMTIVAACYRTFFERMSSMLTAIGFS